MLRAKLNINLIDNHGESPIFKCFYNLHREAAITICSHFKKNKLTNLTIKNNSSQTPIDIANSSGVGFLFGEKLNKTNQILSFFKKPSKENHVRDRRETISSQPTPDSPLVRNSGAVQISRSAHSRNLTFVAPQPRSALTPVQPISAPSLPSLSAPPLGHWHNITREQAEQILLRSFKLKGKPCFLTRNSSLKEHLALSLLKDKTLVHLRMTKTIKGWQLQKDDREYATIPELCVKSSLLESCKWIQRN